MPGNMKLAKDHRRDRRHGIGFKKIRRHAGAVSHVVADKIGNDGGVPRVVFRNPRFNFADKIRADIGALS